MKLYYNKGLDKYYYYVLTGVYYDGREMIKMIVLLEKGKKINTIVTNDKLRKEFELINVKHGTNNLKLWP